MSSPTEKGKVTIKVERFIELEPQSAGVELVKYLDLEQIYMDEIDTETSVTIRALLNYVEANFPRACPNQTRYQLQYNGQDLENLDSTLADYGWVNGTIGKIIVYEQWTDPVPRVHMLSRTII